MSQSFRFIHASDFRLESPVDGLSECPEHLENAILDAPRAAVERLFETALKEKVDFVVLSGDLTSARETGPWSLLFLIEQFEKLAAEKIPVYWATGKNDSPDVVPAAFRFPANVKIFPVGTVEEAFFTRDSVPVARLLGTSWGKAGVSPRGGAEPVEGADDLYTIGVFNGRLPAEALKSVSVRYWALGGTRVRETVSRSPSLAVYAGSTVARNFAETGDFGATLVEIGESGRTTATPFRTSPLRWSTETLVVRDDSTEEEVANEARSRLKALQEKATEDAAFAGRDVAGDVWLVSWRVDAEPSVARAFRYGSLTPTILRELRADFGKAAPFVYSVDLEPSPTDVLTDDACERQTILGDYLRTIRFYLENPNEKIDVASFFSEELRDWLGWERTKRELDARRRTDGETIETSELAARTAGRDFRTELAAIFDALSFETLEEATSGFDGSVSGSSNAEKSGALAALDGVSLGAVATTVDGKSTGAGTTGASTTSGGESEPTNERAARRRRALLRAAELGVDLLDDSDAAASTLGAAAKGASKKNRVVVAELRDLQKNLEGKESLS